MAQGESEKTEKITINLGLVDLGQIDLLVQEGFYTNRTDFIRTAIRTQLAARGVGLSIVQGARAASAASIIAIDRRDDKLALARDVGATHTVNGATSDPVAAVRELTDGRGVDFAFEAIGAPAAIEQAADLLASAGTLVIVGQTPEGARVRLDPFRISDRELRIIGSNYGSCRPPIDFPRILQLDREGIIDLEALITDRIELAAVNDAFAAMHDGAGARTVIMHAH